MLAFDGCLCSRAELIAWLRAQANSLYTVQYDRDFRAIYGRDFYLSASLRDTVSVTLRDESDEFKTVLFGVVAAAPYYNQYTGAVTVNIRCPKAPSQDESLLFNSQLKSLQATEAALNADDTSNVHHFNVTRWISSNDTQHPKGDEGDELDSGRPENHIVLHLIANTTFERDGGAADTLFLLHWVGLQKGERLLVETRMVYQKAFAQQDVPLRSTPMINFGGFASFPEAFIVWFQRARRALINMELDREFQLPVALAGGPLVDKVSTDDLKVLLFGVVSDVPYMNPHSGLWTFNITANECAPSAFASAFARQITALEKLVKAVALSGLDLVHAVLRTQQPFNVFSWTSASHTERWVDDDVERLHAAAAVSHEHIVLQFYDRDAVFERAEYTPGAITYSPLHLRTGEVVIVEVSMRYRRETQSGVPLLMFILGLEHLRVVELL
ncbi:hypothetical protein C8J57DRAFT_1216446 [Mycena rebaudengoi]|nr:hypothetical protein C8J57DRAFT_1216446 [Mycena rebaudengoi]